ncbi:MAG: 4-hydroxybenzoate octaprenyltransferase [Gammaproteobacteria bacterium]|nr:MAG: 4-hydroxybenzoate octaprenyltransferase [Gammaproteobacteria bacterium]
MNAIETAQQKRAVYTELMRIDKPIGTLLLLWPTLWALWFAAEGFPSLKNFVIFSLGVFLMRSAGCVINDYADRHLDRYVERTRNRPLTSGRISEREALWLFFVLCFGAFLLVLMTNQATLLLAFGGLLLAFVYPFMKRHTYLPQVVLGAAFAWAVPMAFMAQIEQLNSLTWLLYLATVVWTIAYDTIYAMVDRDDDVKIGIKSTAILFGPADKTIIAGLQSMTIVLLMVAGYQVHFGSLFFIGVLVAATLFVYQQYLIRNRDKAKCFQAFLHNHYVGLAVFCGLLFETWPV